MLWFFPAIGLRHFAPCQKNPLRALRVRLGVPPLGLADVRAADVAIAEEEGADVAQDGAALVLSAGEAAGVEGGQLGMGRVHRRPSTESG